MKTVIQRNLSIVNTYSIIGSQYVGLENGSCCDNCGRLIANIADIECNETKKRYTVGMDCAETLSGIKGDFTFEYVHKVNFQQAKQARVKVKKMFDKAKEKKVTLICKGSEFKSERDGKEYGGYDIDSEPFNPNYRTWHYYPIEIWSNYVKPMIKEFINN